MTKPFAQHRLCTMQAALQRVQDGMNSVRGNCRALRRETLGWACGAVMRAVALSLSAAAILAPDKAGSASASPAYAGIVSGNTRSRGRFRPANRRLEVMPGAFGADAEKVSAGSSANLSEAEARQEHGRLS